LLKETPSDHPDYENIKKAIKSLEDVTQHINEGMKRADASKKVAMDYDVRSLFHVLPNYVSTHFNPNIRNTQLLSLLY